MEKLDIAKRVVSLRKTVKENENKDLKNPNVKFCPFSEKKRACDSRCKLYRARRGHVGYECPFQEIVPISWNLNAFIKKILGNDPADSEIEK